MADTPRTVAALLTLFANNTSGAITAQALRDMLVSLAGVYGEIIHDGSTTTGQAQSTAEAKINQYTGNGTSAGGVTNDYNTNRRITVPLAGDYQVQLNMAMRNSTAVSVEVHLRQKTSGGSNVAERIVRFDAAVNTDQVVAVGGIFTCSANDVFEVYTKVASGTPTLTCKGGSLRVAKIG